MESSGLTASDVALLGNGNGFGGNNSIIWLFAFLLLANGGLGYGRGEFGQYATAASQQEILFGQQFQNIDNKIDRLGNGIADATFALNNSIKDGNTMVAGRIVDEGRSISSQIAGVRYDINQSTNAINATTIAQTQKILDAFSQSRIDSLQAEVNSLKTQNMFCGIPRINPYGYNVVPANNGCCPCCNV